jgi:hypothetical protein
MDITTDPLLEEFISEKRSPNTQKRATIHLKHYCNYAKQTPTDLIKEAWYENKSDIPPWEKKGIKKKLKGFKEYLENHPKNYSEETVKEAITAARSFYTFHNIPLPRTTFNYKETNTTHRVVRSVADLPGKDEIRQAIETAKPIMKAIIPTMASSGMEASTIQRLTIESFIDSLGDMAETTQKDMLDIDETKEKISRVNGPILKWNVRRKKLGVNGEDYYTFSTPESLDKTFDYLEKQPPHHPTDPLFRTRNETAIGDILFSSYFRRVNKLCGFGKLGKYVYFRSHNLRKYFGNMMDPVLGRRDTEYLMGHQREKDPISRSYYQPDMKALRIAYREHIGRVTFLEEIRYRKVTEEELASVLEDNKTLKEKYNQLEEFTYKKLNEMEENMMKQYKDEFDSLPE